LHEKKAAMGGRSFVCSYLAGRSGQALPAGFPETFTYGLMRKNGSGLALKRKAPQRLPFRCDFCYDKAIVKKEKSIWRLLR
jgi:hypothetical protein